MDENDDNNKTKYMERTDRVEYCIVPVEMEKIVCERGMARNYATR